MPGPDSRPPKVIAVTAGDPLGIGPEITVKALANPAIRARGAFALFAQARALERAAKVSHIEPFWRSGRVGEGTLRAGEVVLIQTDGGLGEATTPDGAPGPTAAGGAASFASVEAAIALAQRSESDPWRARAIVTAPISKTSWDLAGPLAGAGRYPGHTELLAERFGVKRAGMLFVGPSLRVILVTIHIPLYKVAETITAQGVLDAIELGEQACRELGVPRPRVAVAGLNPHAGEGGLLGHEDDAIIRPAVAAARTSGIDVRGPLPGDVVFLQAAKGEHDLVVAMYHDQGLIPVKLLDRDEAVNMTVGLPVIRTSPAHGTAFDVAGMGLAREGGMVGSIQLAANP